MSYRKTKIPVVSSKEGYNDAAALYKSFHKELATYDKGLFQRFLPREITGMSVLDIGAGDSRLYKYFMDRQVRYVAMDVAERLLKRSPSRVEKVVADAEEVWPFEEETFDIELCFFVLLHISDIRHFFKEAYRTLRSGGKIIVLQNYQRRSYEFELPGKKKYKIEDRSHSHNEIMKAGEKAFFTWEYLPLVEKENQIGMLYCFTK